MPVTPFISKKKNWISLVLRPPAHLPLHFFPFSRPVLPPPPRLASLRRAPSRPLPRLSIAPLRSIHPSPALPPDSLTPPMTSPSPSLPLPPLRAASPRAPAPIQHRRRRRLVPVGPFSPPF